MIPVLTYHSIDDSGSLISTAPQKFHDQMQYLADENFSVIPLNEILRYLQENRTLPSRAVALTFDDGYLNFYEHAYPVLKKHGFAATVFIVSGYCGGTNAWEPRNGIPQLPLLTWQQIVELSKDGIDFGAHGVTHSDLCRVSLEKAEEQIKQSRAMIVDHLGKDSRVFAYPYGSFSKQIRTTTLKYFQGACSAEFDLVTLKSDPYALPRLDMYYFSNNNFLELLNSAYFILYVKFRKMLRSFRRQMRFFSHS